MQIGSQKVCQKWIHKVLVIKINGPSDFNNLFSLDRPKPPLFNWRIAYRYIRIILSGQILTRHEMYRALLLFQFRFYYFNSREKFSAHKNQIHMAVKKWQNLIFVNCLSVVWALTKPNVIIFLADDLGENIIMII